MSVAAMAAVAVLLLAFGAAQAWQGRALDILRREAQEKLAIQTEILTSLFDKYRLVPAMLAARRDVVELFAAPEGDPRRLEAAQVAREVQGLSGAPQVVFADAAGAVFGKAVPYSPMPPLPAGLFTAVRQHRLGRASATDSQGGRAYLFASGVWRDAQLLGIVAVAVPLDNLEAAWSLSRDPIFVTNEQGRILLSNVATWRLQTVGAEGAVVPMHREDELATAVVGGSPHSFVEASHMLPLLDWTVTVLLDAQPARNAFWTGGGAALATLVILGLIALFVDMRRETLLRRMRSERAATLRLERRVRDRTRELARTNAELAREVEERAATEGHLRTAQEKLVQTAKLAAIGQMATTLSHEFNQPLTAIQAYAENARRFLERGNADAATRNLGKIEELIRRMGELSQTLLSFARPPEQAIGAVPLSVVVDEALIMMRPKAGKAEVALEIRRPAQPIKVLGGRIRLTQVVVNLVSNAIDAVAGQPDGHVAIAWGCDEDGPVLIVEDNGEGIPDDLNQRIFEPFFTTKGQGKGFGIGLSIVQTIAADFGGSIFVDRSALGGARFEVRLVAADDATLRTDDQGSRMTA
ncbi:sensor histidine kinase [Consotaella aegiceratis]|uniref:sensor histidine kinase n=1 Tax=Consotaella aegiceratis TaxID=3097961 RepID=UPI002F423C27